MARTWAMAASAGATAFQFVVDPPRPWTRIRVRPGSAEVDLVHRTLRRVDVVTHRSKGTGGHPYTDPMRLLLVSTYELGRQPVHVASPAAALTAAGVDVITFDLAVEAWRGSILDDVDAVAFSVPMHTAMRLAMPLAMDLRARRPGLPVALYGLYAGIGEDERDISRFDGEYESDLVAWALGIDGGRKRSLDVGARFHRPRRSTLPGHDNYARLEWMGEARLAAAVEASHGCRHRCRHCPIPVRLRRQDAGRGCRGRPGRHRPTRRRWDRACHFR